jgi:hypothetical protein
MLGFGRLICTSAGQGKANQFKLLAAVGALGRLRVLAKDSGWLWYGRKKIAIESEKSIFRQATMTPGFQRTFPVCEAFRGSSWRYEGVGAMPAPNCLPEQL